MDASTPILVKIAVFLIAFGVAFSLLNWCCLLASYIGRKHVSMAFPFPSLITMLGLALLESTRSYWWIALLTDYTLLSLPSLIATLRESQVNRVQFFRADDPPRHFALSLHEGMRFRLRIEFDPRVPVDRYGAKVSSIDAGGIWWEQPDGQLWLFDYWGDRDLRLKRDGDDYLTTETNYRAGEGRYDSLNALRFTPCGGDRTSRNHPA